MNSSTGGTVTLPTERSSESAFWQMAEIEKATSPATLVHEASAQVYDLFKRQLPEAAVFHNYRHTVDVATAAKRIGTESGLNDEARARVEIAAWFHAAGYAEGPVGHLEASQRLAAEFLESRGASDADIAAVSSLIRAAESDAPADDKSEQVIQDAVHSYLGRKKYFERSERLRMEKARLLGEEVDEKEWLEQQFHQLSTTRFLTRYARRKYGLQKEDNLKTVQRRLGNQLDAKLGLPAPDAGRIRPSRGVETMFRSAYRTHINLSSIADSKANIMISINAILMSIIISFVGARLASDPWLLVPSATLLLTALIAIIFAILSARPNVTSDEPTIEGVRKRKANLLFFGNFVKMSRTDFLEGMHELMRDSDILYDEMALDLYGLGQVLQKKYRLLWISYTVFMAGLALSVALFFVYKAQAPSVSF